MIRSKRHHGFTLVELMVVTAVIGILVVVAVLSLNPDRYSNSARGYAEQVNATIETIRVRATASRKWQRVEVLSDRIVHMEAEDEGMGAPGAYYEVATVSVPRDVRIASWSDRTHTAPDDTVPDVGDGLPGVIDFAPDGSGTAATIFIEDQGNGNKFRVAVFRATGLPRLFEDW